MPVLDPSQRVRRGGCPYPHPAPPVPGAHAAGSPVCLPAIVTDTLSPPPFPPPDSLFINQAMASSPAGRGTRVSQDASPAVGPVQTPTILTGACAQPAL